MHAQQQEQLNKRVTEAELTHRHAQAIVLDSKALTHSFNDRTQKLNVNLKNLTLKLRSVSSERKN